MTSRLYIPPKCHTLQCVLRGRCCHSHLKWGGQQVETEEWRGINLNPDSAWCFSRCLILSSYSHKSIPAYRNFCWGMKFPGTEIRRMSYGRCSSGYGKYFMAEQSKVLRSPMWGAADPPPSLGSSWASPRSGGGELSLPCSGGLDEIFLRSLPPLIFYDFCEEFGFLKENFILLETVIHILGWGWIARSNLLFLLMHILPARLLRQTVVLLLEIQYN